MIHKNNLTKLLGLLLVLGVFLFNYFSDTPQTQQKQEHYKQTLASVEEAFSKKQSDVQVSGSGIVLRLLKDDTDGHKHQKILLRLASGKTLLIAHNIDLAPRIHSLKEGDTLEFYGEYEYNTKGGIVHWTHHDPQKRHTDGWLKHNGKTYR
jgi:molybdopterin converting factor small subunit